ncbi:glycosyltransferase family 4 protein [Ralstonia solanacearum]|uniref:glycosyltransferase family 4 protein n=1 Tax=Ralstonia solanacearum TaxID=305 RepID=UPI0001D97EBF|nr:glycosyltransferase family 1 protein [Ralstonia solanacearum]CBJ51873.1 putative glycosyltransferase [Ralstonia solanacearum PSI07]
MKRWLEQARAAVHVPAFVERRRVPLARARLSQACHADTAAPGQKQLLVDISVIARHDARTGIQRVVRAVLGQLLASAPAGYAVRPVAASRRRPYRYAAWEEAGVEADPTQDIAIRPGDIFLGLDLAAHIVPVHRHQLAGWKARGAALHFVIYDLLPLQHPEWFPARLVVAFRRWLRAVAVLADNAICISHVVESELIDLLEHRYGLPPGCVGTRVVPMGWDVASTQPSRGLPPDFDALLSRIRQHKTTLMVGTLEPRKGHAQILDAFEQLWHSGKDYNLVIVGRPGWKTDGLQARLRRHPQGGQHLFWLDNASDEALLALYDACDGVVNASYGEGFGLPMIEALGRGKSVLARDLPVFRHAVHSGVEYFSAQDPGELPRVIATWLEQTTTSTTQSVLAHRMPVWRDTVSALIAGFDAAGGESGGTGPVPEKQWLGAA